jgi:hypothetical protein
MSEYQKKFDKANSGAGGGGERGTFVYQQEIRIKFDIEVGTVRKLQYI